MCPPTVDPYHPRQFAEWLLRRTAAGEACDLPAALTLGDLYTLVALAEHADWPTGENARPSIRTLARRTGLNPDTVRRALTHLADVGLIQRTGDHPTRGGRVAVYRLARPKPPSAKRTAHPDTTDPKRAAPPYALPGKAYGPAGESVRPGHGKRPDGPTRSGARDPGPGPGGSHPLKARSGRSVRTLPPEPPPDATPELPAWAVPGVLARFTLEGAVGDVRLELDADGRLVFRHPKAAGLRLQVATHVAELEPVDAEPAREPEGPPDLDGEPVDAEPAREPEAAADLDAADLDGQLAEALCEPAAVA